MSTAGRCMAASTASGITVGPGIARNSRPADRGMRIRADGRARAAEEKICSTLGAARGARRELRHDGRPYLAAANTLALISMANRSSSFDQAGPPRPAEASGTTALTLVARMSAATSGTSLADHRRVWIGRPRISLRSCGLRSYEADAKKGPLGGPF